MPPSTPKSQFFCCRFIVRLVGSFILRFSEQTFDPVTLQFTLFALTGVKGNLQKLNLKVLAKPS